MFTIDVRTTVDKNRINLQTLITANNKNTDRTIQSVTVSLNGLVINQMQMSSSMAHSPYFAIRFKGFVNDKYEIICIDDFGEVHSRKGKIVK